MDSSVSLSIVTGSILLSVAQVCHPAGGEGSVGIEREERAGPVACVREGRLCPWLLPLTDDLPTRHTKI
jgi:hypothetical protein